MTSKIIVTISIRISEAKPNFLNRIQIRSLYSFSLCPYSDCIWIVLCLIYLSCFIFLFSIHLAIKLKKTQLNFSSPWLSSVVARDLSGQRGVIFSNSILQFFSDSLRNYTIKEQVKGQRKRIFDDQGNNKTCSLRKLLSHMYFLTTVSTRRSFTK